MPRARATTFPLAVFATSTLACASPAERLLPLIEHYCAVQGEAPRPGAPARALGAPCFGPMDCDSAFCPIELEVESRFCSQLCTVSVDCDSALPTCVTTRADRGVCVPLCFRFATVEDCTLELTLELEVVERGGRCASELEAWIRCLDSSAPFCTTVERDSWCARDHEAYVGCRGAA